MPTPNTEPLTLRHILLQLLDHERALQYSPHTSESTRSGVAQFLDWLMPTHDIHFPSQLRPEHLHAYQKRLADHRTPRGLPLKPSALNSKVKAIHRFLDFLNERSYTHLKLRYQLHYIKEPQVLPTSVLTHAQVKKLLRQINPGSIEGIRDRAAIELLYSTGIRIGELSTLSLDYLDLDAATMKVTGKGSKERLVPIGRTALRHLLSYLRIARPYLLQQSTAAATDRRLCFLNAQGQPLPGHTLRQAIHRYAQAAGLDVNVTPHTFRRSCTTEMIKGDANLYHIKEILGHETLNTLKHYTRLQITDLQKTHAKCHPREKDGSTPTGG
jgi:integrase/recombinase XerD